MFGKCNGLILCTRIGATCDCQLKGKRFGNVTCNFLHQNMSCQLSANVCGGLQDLSNIVRCYLRPRIFANISWRLKTQFALYIARCQQCQVDTYKNAFPSIHNYPQTVCSQTLALLNDNTALWNLCVIWREFCGQSSRSYAFYRQKSRKWFSEKFVADKREAIPTASARRLLKEIKSKSCFKVTGCTISPDVYKH